MTFVVWFESFWVSIYDEIFGEPVAHPLLRRGLAFFIDALLFSAFTSIIAIILTSTEFAIDIFYYLGFHLFITTLYFAVLNSKIGNGKTLGKRIFKLKVVDENSDYIGFRRSLLRSVPVVLILNSYELTWTMHVAEVDFVYITYGLGIFLLGMIYFSVAKLNRQGLHDLIFSTQVIAKDISVTTKKDLSARLVLGFGLFLVTVFYSSYWYVRFVNN